MTIRFLEADAMLPLPPLRDGERLDQPTFHTRYEAMPPESRAELIGGIVHLGTRSTMVHGELKGDLVYWLANYGYGTPGTEALGSVTVLLGAHSEPEPDGCLLITGDGIGQTHEEDGYLAGAPELVVEVAAGLDSVDFHAKKRDYEQAGVKEYLVLALRQQVVFWFQLRRGKYENLLPRPDGILRSETFPGLWLDPTALLHRGRQRMRAVAAEGLASLEHAAFVASLATHSLTAWL